MSKMRSRAPLLAKQCRIEELGRACDRHDRIALTMMQQLSMPLIVDNPDRRLSLESRWLTLVRDHPPAMAERCGWPISQDHCFMRVCLDISVGCRWTRIVKRPAIRHMTDEQLLAAIAVADDIVRAPETLHALNSQSLHWRKNAAGKPDVEKI